MSSRRSSNKENVNNLSSFGERLKRLSDTFYSTILQEEKEEKVQIKNAKQLEDFQYNDFTFDECSTSQITSNDHFSFTFHSIDQTNSQIYHKSKITPTTNHSSTPYSIPRQNLIKKAEDDTIVVEENPSLPPLQPIIVGYYPVISYQPVSLPPIFYYSKEEIQSERNDYSTLTKITPIKKK